MTATDGGVSLHVYVPSITAMAVFDRERRETLVLDDDCGAWIPEDPKLIRGRTAWPVAAQVPVGLDGAARLHAMHAR
jgi:hypothetical protein